jgi:dephospho-CoA kinase
MRASLARSDTVRNASARRPFRKWPPFVALERDRRRRERLVAEGFFCYLFERSARPTPRPTIMTTRLFGLTGNIASGKSSVARRYAARGVPVLDADRFARDVVAPGTDGLREVVEAFGPGVLDAEGALDRRALGALVFGDPAKRARLNAITHVRIAAATQAALAELQARGAPVGCYEASLLVENGVADAFRPLVVVLAPAARQREWLMRRDGLSEADALARIGSQLDAAEKARAADFVIENAGSPDELVARADETLAALLARLGVDPALYPAPAG